MSINRVVLTGRLTKDPELKYTPSGKAVANMSIAVDRITKDSQCNYETDFFNVTAWGKTAEFANNYLAKGRLVAIDGRIQNRSWVGQQDGVKHTVTDIVAENINGLDKPKEGFVAKNAGGQAPTPVESPVAAAPAAPEVDDDDSGDPFADE